MDAPPPKLRLSSMLATLAAESEAGGITMGDLVDRTAHAGFGFVIGLLCLASLPFVGLSTPFGLAISFVALQMVFARERPWVPGWLRRRKISPEMLRGLAKRLAGFRLERVVKPRWLTWVRAPLWPLVGLGVGLLGLGLALPIPIPGSNAIFSVPILIYAIGLLEDDGVLVAVGHLATLVHVLLGIMFWMVVRDAVVQMIHWLS